MIGHTDGAAQKAKAAGITRVREWIEEGLPGDERDEDEGGTAPPGKETNVMVNQLACQEEGCPDVETVMALARAKPRPRLMFKIYKAAADLTREEVGAAMESALAKERGDDAGHGHGAAPAAAAAEED